MLLKDERELVIRLREGDPKAFLFLYKQYHNKLFNFCMKYLKSEADVNEVIQNVFIAIWNQHEQLDETKSFSSYIFSIAKYKAYHVFKRNLYAQSTLETITNQDQFLDEETIDKVLYNEMKEKIYSIIEELPEKRKIIFRLNRFYGLTYNLIASKLQISENTVDTSIRKSLKFIKKRYLELFK